MEFPSDGRPYVTSQVDRTATIYILTTIQKLQVQNETTNKAIPAQRLGRENLTNVAAVAPRVKECTLGTHALHAA